MQKDLDFERAVRAQFNDFIVKVNLEDETYKIEVVRSSKSVEITWPFPLFELFFDFKKETATLYSQSLEYYDSEKQEVVLKESARVVSAFLNHETKIVTLGRFFKRTELQFSSELGWISVFNA